MTSGVGLEWVIFKHRRVQVSEFAHLHPSARPAVRCPECGEPLTLKLGKVRRHHAAHKAGTSCPAVNPETALHLNVKYYLARVLETAIGGGVALRIRRRCLVGNRPYRTGGEASWIESTASACAEVDDAVWAAGWDEVRVEERIAARAGHRTPDVALLENGKPVGAIEVFVSHAVDPVKATVLAQLGVPWIEILASEDLYRPETAWTIEQPLQPHRASIPLDWRCEAHRAASGADPSRVARVAERPPEREQLVDGRIVDVYFSGGTWRRWIYRVRGSFANSTLVRIALDRNGELLQSWLAIRDESEAAFKARVRKLLQAAYRSDVARLSRRTAIIDEGRWLKKDSVRLLEHAPRMERRYRFDSINREWQLKPPSDSTSRALDGIEAAVRGRRSPVQQSLLPKDE